MQTQVGDPLRELVVDEEKARLMEENRSLKNSVTLLRASNEKLRKRIEYLEGIKRRKAPRESRCGERIRMPDRPGGRKEYLVCDKTKGHDGYHRCNDETWGTPRAEAATT